MQQRFLATALIAALTSVGFAQTNHAKHIRFNYSRGASADFYGNAVNIVGDLNKDGCDECVIAATRAGAGAGEVLVYNGADGRVLFKASGTATSNLGYRVAPAGDVNKDGFPDVVAGAPFADSGTVSNNGMVRVFSGKDFKILYTFYGTQANEWLGYSVWGDVDINFDGYDDIIAGAPYYDAGGTLNVGRAVVYSGKDGKILKTHFGTAANERVGYSVCGCNVGTTAFDDYAIGAVGANTGAGRVDVYTLFPTAKKIYTWNGAAGDNYGHFLANGGDVNKDGVGDVIVASYSSDHVVAFSGKDGKVIWKCVGGKSMRHGWTCGGNSDVDGDGYMDILAGAGAGAFPGSTLVWSGKTGKVILDVNGYQAAGGGDLNGDGFDDIVAGTWLNSGVAWVYNGKALSMQTDKHQISRATGGTQAIKFDCGVAQANRTYWVFGSVTGTKPGITLGVHIPLNYDPYTDLTIALASTGSTGVFQKFRGTLDSSGTGTASFVVPSTVPADVTVYHSVVVYTGGTFHFASNATSCRIQ